MKVIDGRDMQPPEPFERVVEALASLAAGEQVLLILNREPIPLYDFLGRNNYLYKASAKDDGRIDILIWRQS